MKTKFGKNDLTFDYLSILIEGDGILAEMQWLDEIYQHHLFLVNEAVEALRGSENIVACVWDGFKASLVDVDRNSCCNIPVGTGVLADFPNAIGRIQASGFDIFEAWFWPLWNANRDGMQQQMALRAVNQFALSLLQGGKTLTGYDMDTMLRELKCDRSQETKYFCRFFNALQRAAMELFVVEALVEDVAAV